MLEYNTLLDDDNLAEFRAELDQYAAINKFSYSLEVKPLHLVNEVVLIIPPFAITALRSALFFLTKKGGKR